MVEMVDSSAVGSDAAELWRRFDRDGYVLVRQAVPKEVAEAARVPIVSARTKNKKGSVGFGWLTAILGKKGALSRP